MWRGAFGVSGIAWPGFIAKEMVNGRTPAVAFLRCGGVEGHVRTKMVVPVEVQFDFIERHSLGHRYDDLSRGLVL